jgi:hypothetical protein
MTFRVTGGGKPGWAVVGGEDIELVLGISARQVDAGNEEHIGTWRIEALAVDVRAGDGSWNRCGRA